MRIALTAFCLACCPAVFAAELDLYVTDYDENPAPEQQPLVARPISYAAPRQVTIKTAGGREVQYDAPNKVMVEPQTRGDQREARLFASQAEYEPFSFLLRPQETLEDVMITASDLRGPVGVISHENVVVASVEGFHDEGRRILLRLGHPWNMASHSTEYFWYTVHVPEDAAAGEYRGQIVVTSQDRPVGRIEVVLEVLPIRLDDPPFALGYNYSSPKDPEALKMHLADMRRHGMTTVAPLYDFHLPVYDDDTSELGELIEAYREAGFPATLYFATPMNLQLSALAGFGDETSKRWQQKYIEVMQRMQAELQRHDVPVIVSIGDELTNKGVEGVKIAERLARFVWEELPEIATTSDMNGYLEVMAMSPYLNVATFNNGWDGIDHHNQGRTLVNREFITQLQESTGAIPWFVNTGSGRFPFGFFFWKMTRYGVRGKVEWYYNLRNERGSLVRCGDGGEISPTLDYERSREGIDDLKYLCKLEELIAATAESEPAAAERAKAVAFLEKLFGSIEDDINAYRSGGARFPADGFEVMDPDKAAGLGSLNVVRRAVADRIVALQRAASR